MADPIALPSDADHTGREFGYDELALLREVLESGTLNCTRGTQVKAFEREFAERYGVPHARAVSSGTAACHGAIAAIKRTLLRETLQTITAARCVTTYWAAVEGGTWH
jgi:dTDP-4-amino-4,6-dideoxygalactose transaminase